jgi:hypothetical protein
VGCESNASRTQPIEVWSFYDLVPRTTERIGSELIQGDEDHVHVSTLAEIIELSGHRRDVGQLGA